jgi:RecA-family ATPase
MRPLADLAFTANELAGGEAPPRPWHVENVIPGRSVTLLQGDGGTGKSILALQLAVATVLGLSWISQEVRRGNALYLSAEDDRNEIHRRLEAIAASFGADLADLAGLKVLDVAGEDAVLACADRAGRLVMTDRWHELSREIQAWEPVVVIIDNLADVFGGEENSRPHARQFVSQLQGCARRVDASFVLIGHPSLAGMASGSGSSGSTAWNNSVRSRLYFTRPAGADDAPPSTDSRLLTVKKANYGPANLELRVAWRSGVFQLEDGFASNLTSLDRHAAQNRADVAFLQLLEAYEVQGRTVSHQHGRNWAPALFAKDPGAAGTTKAGFEAAMNRLFAAGQLGVKVEGPPSRQRSRIARTEGDSDA